MTDTAPQRRPRLGPLVIGVLLIFIGILWFIDIVDAVDVSWAVLLPGALIVVGLALMYGARTGRHGGLVTFGVFLAIFVVLASAIDVLIEVPITGGIGDEAHRPIGAASAGYHWGIGKMAVDLTQADLPDTPMEVTLGIGELVVVLPAGASLNVRADAGIGQVDLFGRIEAGISPELTAGPGGSVQLVVRVGLGRVEVRYG